MRLLAAGLVRVVVRYALRSGLGKQQKETAPQLQRKKIARFTQYVIKGKAKELLGGFINAQLQAGVKVEHVDLRSRWFSDWRHEYGLSSRRPNRRYKVKKAVIAERLEIGWINVFRVRAACAALKGYDPTLRTGINLRFITTNQAQITSRLSQLRAWKFPWWRCTRRRVCGGRQT